MEKIYCGGDVASVNYMECDTIQDVASTMHFTTEEVIKILEAIREASLKTGTEVIISRPNEIDEIFQV